VSKSKSETTTDLDTRLILDFLDIIILKLIKMSNFTSGYHVVKYLHQKFHLMVSAGTVYSLLYSLERKDLIEGDFDGRRRVYKLTKQGEAFFDRIRATQQRTHTVLSSIFAGA
jgi:DNA-binding PadR family transcriptional regulator